MGSGFNPVLATPKFITPSSESVINDLDDLMSTVNTQHEVDNFWSAI